MSLESEIRRDTNPTPTRFLMECGAFTPGLGLSLEPCNPFETSYKLLHSGTPNGEGNPFDMSFKPTVPSEPIYQPQSHYQLQDQQDQHPWVGHQSDDVRMDHCYRRELSSPGLASPSTTPSPPSSLKSPTSPLPLHFRKSSIDVHLSPPHFLNGSNPVEYPAYFDKDETILMRNSFIADATMATSNPTSTAIIPTSLVPADLHRFTPPSSDITTNSPERIFSRDEEEGEEDGDEQKGDLDDRNTTQMQLDHDRRYRRRHDSGMVLDEIEARELARQQHEEDEMMKEAVGATVTPSSPLSAVREEEMQEEDDEESEIAMAEDDEPVRAPVTRSRAISKSSTSAKATSANKSSSKNGSKVKAAQTTSGRAKSTTAKAVKTVNAGKASAKPVTSAATKAGGGGGKSAQIKKQSVEEESPEVKRQRFLERNRLAASKCREKKRLQTLKTIADADTITLRNQELHDQLSDLQEQVRSLKTQILCHRDCGCDVIQKFVRSTFEHGMPSPSSSAMMQPHHPHPAFQHHTSSTASQPPYHQATLASAMMATTTPFSM